LVLVSCKPAEQKPQAPAPVANVRATVISVRVTTEPPKQAVDHTIAIAKDKARSSDELDTWRLYDLKANSVTFVDDIEKTFRTIPFTTLLEQHRAATAKPRPPETPPATLQRPARTQTVAGVPASLMTVNLGKYERQLWIGHHPAVPPQLFAMMYASNPPSSPLAPVMRDVDEALLNVRGFPLLERGELPYGKSKMVVERAVTSIGAKDVPAAMFEVPKGYRDVTPPPPVSSRRRVKAPAASPRSAS
jgi:hypothetical protein